MSSLMLSALDELASQNMFWQWVADQGKPIEISRPTALGLIRPAISHFVKSFRPRVRDCFNNAFSCAESIPDVNVVHGYASFAGDDVNEHAWNEFNGHHFDITPQGRGKKLKEYLDVVHVPLPECRRFFRQSSQHSHLVWNYYLQQLDPPAYITQKDREIVMLAG